MAGFSFGTPAAQPAAAAAAAAAQPAFSFGAAPAIPFGASGSTSKSAAGTGAFGFGAKPATPVGGGLFGASQPQASAATGTSTGTGLFGGAAGTSMGTGLFGSTFGQQGQQAPGQGPQQGGGVFGPGSTSTFGGFGQNQNQQQNQQQQQPQAQEPSLFGSTPQSLFSAQPPSQPQSSGLFGQPNPASSFQQAASEITYRANQPGRLGLNSIWVPEGPLTRRSVPRDEMFKFTAEGDPALAGLLRELESELNRQKTSFDEINTGSLGNDIWTLREKTKQLSSGYYTYTATTNSLQRHLGALQSTIQTLQDDLYKAASVVQWQMGHPDDLKGFEGVRDVPAEFFTKIARDCEVRAEGYKKALDQIERQLQSLWNNQNVPSAQAISQSMSNNQDLIMALAVQVAEIDERVRSLVDAYRHRFREKYQTTKDPVSERRRVDGLPAKGYSGDRDDGLLSGMAGVGFR